MGSTLLLSDIEFDKARVELSNAPIVLLCGGSVKIKNQPDDPDPPLSSLRDAISRSTFSYEIFRPEEITSWQADGIFKNLMTFETDLAAICTLVVIILESAGSLVELGAFSQLSELSEKIIAIRSNKFQNDRSFINLGILRYIAEKHKSSIKSYTWDIEEPSSITVEIINDVISDIEDELGKLKKSEVLNLKQSSHLIVLICEIIQYFVALKESEIFDFLNTIGGTVSKDELKRKLFLLEEFKLIRKEQYSDSTFYLRSDEKYHRLRFSLKSGRFDELRFQIECIEYYNTNTKHRNRVRAIAQSKRGLTR